MNIKSISSWCVAAAVCLLPQSCDKNDPSVTLPGAAASSIGMNLEVAANSIIPVRSDAGTLTRVFGDPEDDITMTEYVSDITDAIPETKGTIITTTNIPTSYGEFLVNAYRPFYQGELAEVDDKDNEDNDDDVYDNTTKSKTTKAVRDFSMTSSYSGGNWNWSGNQPHWRNKAVYSIWSMSPANSSNLSPATLSPTTPQPAWTDLSSITDVDPTGKTAEQIEELEEARRQAIQAKFRSLTFDYTLPHYAPITNSTSIYKDLLFAYNEEMREFEVEDGKLKEDVNGNHIIKNGKTESFDVKFYHALAAVKFELESTTTGADIHSVTVCYTDASGNIVTTDGIATKGTCTASATGGDGSNKVDFSWPETSLTNKKPMHFVFNDGTSSTTKVSGGYANTGDGVLFMIPQSASNLKVIVEFSKYGGTEYFTKVITSPTTSGLNINWEAGKCYTYKFKIGEFHVPGEPLVGKASLSATNIKFTHGGIAYSSFIPAKGVERIGLVLDGYNTKDNGAADFYLYAVFDGNTPSASTYNPPTPETFEYDFLDVTLPTTGAVLNTTYTFGDGATETYSTAYHFDLYPTKTYTGLYYYVFKVNSGASTFNIGFSTNSSNNSAFFKGNILGILVLKVEEDPNLPNDFNEIDWANI